MPKKIKLDLSALEVSSFQTTSSLKGGDYPTGPVQCRTNAEHCWNSRRTECTTTENTDTRITIAPVCIKSVWCTAPK